MQLPEIDTKSLDDVIHLARLWLLVCTTSEVTRCIGPQSRFEFGCNSQNPISERHTENRLTVSPPRGQEIPHLALRSLLPNFKCCLTVSVDIFSRSDFVCRNSYMISRKPGTAPSAVGHVGERSSNTVSLSHF